MAEDVIEGINPTRMELLEIRRRRALAMKGHEILSKKRDALIQEFFEIVARRGNLRRETLEKLSEARGHMVRAEIAGGPEVEVAVAASPPMAEVRTDSANIMGVAVPMLHVEGHAWARSPSYGLLTTPGDLDRAHASFQEALAGLLRLAEIDGALERMAYEIEKTKRRVNALEHIIVPRLQGTERYINMQLEEREREEFFRRKRIKAIMEGRGG